MTHSWLSRAAALFLAAGIAVSSTAVAGPYVTVSHRTVVAPAPPRAPLMTRPLRPTVQHVWIEGQWAWDGYRYNWQPGYWRAPQVVIVNTPAYRPVTYTTVRQPVRQPVRRAVVRAPARPATRVVRTAAPCRR